MKLRKKAFQNIKGKGENVGNQHFFYSPNILNPFKDKFCHLGHPKFVVSKCFQFGLV